MAVDGKTHSVLASKNVKDEIKFIKHSTGNKETSFVSSVDGPGGSSDLRMMKAESHRLEKLFHEIDTNKDGRIDAHELSEGLKRMGYCHISEPQVEVS